MKEGYSCDICGASMSESSYIENQGVCYVCFKKAVMEEKEIIEIEKFIEVNHDFQ